MKTTTKSKTSFLDSARRRSAKPTKPTTAKTEKVLPDDTPTTPTTSKTSKPKKVAPDELAVLTLTQTEQTSGRTIPEILKARRDRGEKVPSKFRLSAMPECARYAGGGYVLPM